MKWWAIPVALVVGLFIALVWRRNPLRQITNELRAIDRAAEVKLRVAEHGATIARRAVEADHAETIRKFDDAQRTKRDELRADPVRLSKWLERLSD